MHSGDSFDSLMAIMYFGDDLHSPAQLEGNTMGQNQKSHFPIPLALAELVPNRDLDPSCLFFGLGPSVRVIGCGWQNWQIWGGRLLAALISASLWYWKAEIGSDRIYWSDEVTGILTPNWRLHPLWNAGGQWNCCIWTDLTIKVPPLVSAPN